MSKHDEIKSLNFADLDVEELEHRLELAATIGEPLGVWCDCNTDVCTCRGTYTCNNYSCPTNCACNGYEPCIADCIKLGPEPKPIQP